MVNTLATSGACILKAGVDINEKFLNEWSDAEGFDSFINEAESDLIVVTRKDWIVLYEGLHDNVKKIIDQTVSAMVGSKIINHDTSAIPSREAETRLDYLDNEIKRGQSILRDIKQQKFITDADGT